MCVLTHKHRRRVLESAAVNVGTLSVRAPAPEQGRLPIGGIRMLVEEAGEGPGEAGGGVPDFRVLEWWAGFSDGGRAGRSAAG